MNRKQEFVTIRGRDYIILYTRPIGRQYYWEAFRIDDGHWKPIPAMSRSDCRRFPKGVAQHAQAKTNELNGVEVQA